MSDDMSNQYRDGTNSGHSWSDKTLTQTELAVLECMQQLVSVWGNPPADTLIADTLKIKQQLAWDSIMALWRAKCVERVPGGWMPVRKVNSYTCPHCSGAVQVEEDLR